MLKNKKILLIVSGSIAAYKIPLLVRLLKKNGAEVKVVLTPSACEFVTPLTLSTLSGNPVYTGFTFDNANQWVNHVDLGLWANLLIIAPATANTLSKMARGNCDNLAMAVYLSARCPVMFAPAMDEDMYHHPATQENIATLVARKNRLIPTESGSLASGLIGYGRMAEPAHILKYVQDYFSKSLPFSNKKILITAGPTFEPIDPVRFLGNRSTGKMGIALAQAFSNAGAHVILISGPSVQTQYIESEITPVECIQVHTADEMYSRVMELWPQCDVGIMAAAVADYKPKHYQTAKIKKTEDNFQLDLVKNKDILKAMGEVKKHGQYLTGFALETDHGIENAKQKLQQKNLDLIILNMAHEEGSGIGSHNNHVTLISKETSSGVEWPLMTKIEVAEKIVNYIASSIA